jgi:hypothetical protein
MPLDNTPWALPAVKPATFDPVLREGLAGPRAITNGPTASR